MSAGAIIVAGANVGGATVGGANVAGANVSEHLSRSICRIFRSNCRRSICRVTTENTMLYLDICAYHFLGMVFLIF